MTYWEQVGNYHKSREAGYTYFGADAENFKGLGTEVEFDTTANIDKETFREAVAEILLTHPQKEHYFVEKDRSLMKGMELITQPHTVEAMRTFIAEAMPDIFTRVCAAGAEDLSLRAALHVHIGKNVFGDTYETQKENISKLWYFVSQNSVRFFRLGNRTETIKCLFPTPKLTKETAKAKVDIEYDTETKVKVKRYQAINLKQPNTVEFRAMQGTTDVNVLTALVEMWWHLANRSTVIDWENANSWEQWFDGAPAVVTEYIASKLEVQNV